MSTFRPHVWFIRTSGACMQCSRMLRVRIWFGCESGLGSEFRIQQGLPSALLRSEHAMHPDLTISYAPDELAAIWLTLHSACKLLRSPCWGKSWRDSCPWRSTESSLHIAGRERSAEDVTWRCPSARFIIRQGLKVRPIPSSSIPQGTPS